MSIPLEEDYLDITRDNISEINAKFETNSDTKSVLMSIILGKVSYA